MDPDQNRSTSTRQSVDSDIPLFTIVHYRKDKADDAFRRQTSSPLDFLCLKVGGSTVGDGNFPGTVDAIDWVTAFRKLETAGLVERIQAGEARSDGPVVPAACVLVVVDPLEVSPSAELSPEFSDREQLIQMGAILVERSHGDTVGAGDCTTIEEFIRNSLAAVQQQITPIPVFHTPPVGSIFKWQSVCPGQEAAAYGREMPHTPLPSHDELLKQFKNSYRPDDTSAQQELDY